MSQSIFASPEPDTRPNDNTPTEIHVDDNNLGDSGANILQTSIEIDDDMDPSRVEDNKSPSELTQPYSTPVTYPPPPPTNDPTGFYTDAFRRVFPEGNPVNRIPARPIPIPRKNLSAAKVNPKENLRGSESPLGRAPAIAVPAPRENSVYSEESPNDQSPTSPTRRTLAPQRQWSESPPLNREPAQSVPTPRINPSAVNNTKEISENHRTTTHSHGGFQKPLSEYRRRQNQAALRKARSSQNGSPNEQQQQQHDTVEKRFNAKGMLPQSIQSAMQTSPSGNGARRTMAQARMPRSEESFKVYSPGPITPNPRRRQRSPSPAPSGFSPLRGYSPELAPSSSPIAYSSYEDYKFQQVERSGRKDVRHDFRIPEAPRRMMVQDSYADDFDNDFEYGGEENEEDDNDDNLFVSPRIGSGPSPPKKLRLDERPQYSSRDWLQREPRRPEITRDPIPSHFNVPREGRHPESIRGPIPSAFNIPGKDRLPSRYSGAEMPWGVNQDPVMVDQNEVSNASLKKRGLNRGQGDKVCKRGYGANDPENIAIVNYKEVNDYSFSKIAQLLNEKRIAEGRKPSMTACGVTSRYNRTAPLLFAAQGKAFIPLSKRRGMVDSHGNSTGKPAWNDALDELLVDKVKEFEQSRWPTIAQLMQEVTGLQFDAESVAQRHTML